MIQDKLIWCRLKENGGWLSPDDVEMVSTLSSEVVTFDLTGEDQEKEICVEGRQHPARGYFVKMAMARCIAPELQQMDSAFPGALDFWATHGVDIVLAADGTSRSLFNGTSAKLEIGACKILLRKGGPWDEPWVGGTGAQQAASLAIPLFVHDGVGPQNYDCGNVCLYGHDGVSVLT